MMSTLTVEQMRMARAALGWSFEIMAEKCGVSSRTLRRIESEDGLQKATNANLRLIRETLQAAGIDRVLTMDLHADQIQGFSISQPITSMVRLCCWTIFETWKKKI